MSAAGVGSLFTKLGLPFDVKDFELAESVANYGWAANLPWGKEASQWAYGLKICGWIFDKLSVPPETLLLINILTVETQAAICQYVKDNPRKAQAELSAEVQRRLEVYAAQVDLIKRGVLVLSPGGGSAGAPAHFSGSSSSGSRGGGGVHFGASVVDGGRGSSHKPAIASQPAVLTSTKTADSRPKAEQPIVWKQEKAKQTKPTDKPAATKPSSAPARQPSSKTHSPVPKSTPMSTPKSRSPEPILVSPPKPSRSPEPAAVMQETPIVAETPEDMIVKVPAEVYQGTVVPADNLDPEEDAAALRKAMKGRGCDDKAVIAVLAFRSVAQRQEIADCFQAKFGKKLRSELDSELSGNVKTCVKGLMMERDEYDAYLLYTAMKGLGTDESVLNEILASRPNDALCRVRQRFADDYSKDLLQQIKSETSGDYRTFLLRLAEANREESDTVDLGQARADAQALHDAGEGRRGTNEAVFIDILSQRSFPQLRATFDVYQEMFGKEFLKVVDSETSGDFRNVLSAVVKCAVDTQLFFAERLHKAMKGLGTNDDMLVRIIVTRCEIDTVQIKQRFQQRYGKTLKSFIEGDTGGNYKRLLLALLDET